MLSSRVAVLDCGASHTALGVFAKAGTDRLRLTQFAFESFVLEPGREEEWLDRTTTALRGLRARVKLGGAVSVVLPGHLVLIKFIKTPRVDITKRDRVIQFEAQQAIPYALTDVVWGHVVTGETDIDLEVMLCAIKREIVDALCAAIESIGLTPKLLLPSSLALRAAYGLAQTAQAPTTLLVDIGARSSTLLLNEGKRLHARTLALGGQNVTQQISESQDCEFSEAEQLKLSGRHTALCAPAVENFVTRLSQEVTRSALHFRRSAGAGNPERVLLTGGSALIPGIAEMMTAKLHVPVGGFDALGAVEVARAAADGHVAEYATMISPLIGAAVVQIRADQLSLNLLPPRLRARENTRRQQPWLAAAACLTAAALLAPLMHYRALHTEVQFKLGALNAQIDPLREREAQNRVHLEQLTALRVQVEALEHVYNRRANWQAMLADLQNRLVKVEDVWFERLTLAPGSGDANAPLRIAVSGRMLDKANPLANVSPDTFRRVTALLGGLADSPYVAAVENERFDNRQPGILYFDFVLVAETAKPL